MVALATMVALFAFAGPASAQSSSSCPRCTQEQREDARRELEEAMQEFHGVLATYRQAVEALSRDSSSASRARLAKVNRELRASSRRLELASARLTRLESEAVQVRVPARAPVRTRVRAAAPARTGYMGVNLSASATTKRGKDGLIYWEFSEYPKLESVEPGSPAERAGLLAGDRLMSLDNRDVTEGVLAFTKLLVPGKRLDVRVRRQGETKSFTLVVDERPVRAIVWAGPRGAAPVPDAEAFVEVIPVPVTPRSPRPVATPSSPNAPAPTAAPMTPMPPMGFDWHVAESLPLAGANLVAIKGDLREYFGVSRGALITQVAAGTPASRAGLKGGDVIVAAAGARVSTPHDVQMALERSAERRSMAVEIVRKKERRRVTIRW